MAKLDRVNPQLLEILNAAADDFPYRVQVTSGYRGSNRLAGSQHGKGNAIDVLIYDNDGKPIPNYQKGESFKIYEQFAQLARKVQQEKYPQLDKNFRWGGYFSGNKNYGAMDLMHFDAGGTPTLGMAGGSWDKGLNDQQRAYYPSAESSGQKAINNVMAYTSPEGAKSQFPRVLPVKKQQKNEDSYDDLIKEFGVAPVEAKPGQPGFELTIGGPKPKASEDSYDDLINEFGGKTETPKGDLSRMILGQTPGENPIVDTAAQAEGIKGTAARTGVGVLRGVKDVLDTGVRGITSLARPVAKILPESIGKPIIQNIDETLAADAVAKRQFDERLGESTAANVGRIGGQIAATAPLVPTAGLTSVGNALFNAAPRLTAAGETVAAPLLNRGASLMAQGAGAGAIYGGATGQPIGENALLGAAGAPVAAAAGKALGAAVQGGSNLINKWQVNRLARNAGIEPTAARNILARLEDVGITPQQAQQELKAMGPKATIADLDAALTAEASGVASMGGKPTSILKNTFNQRAAGANDEANRIMETKLGPKPDFEVEKDAIVKSVQQATSADYKAAHTSKTPVDTTNIINSIDNQLEKNVGSTATNLAEIRKYLYDSKGNLRTDSESLHNVRIELDNLLDKLPKEGTSSNSKAYKAVENVRNDLDAELKKNPQMAAADQKYAEAMRVREGLEIGRDFLKGTREDFQKAFHSANPETQEAIRKGMRVQIGDLMEKAQRGELAGAQQMFSKASANRAKFQVAFGQDADEVLDALSREASFRASERAVTSGSQTAERQAIQGRYRVPDSSGPGNMLMSGAMDVATGSPGVITTANAVRQGGNFITRGFKERAADRLTTGTADLLSRQAGARDNALNALSRANALKRFNVSPNAVNNLLPASAPVGSLAYQQGASSYESANRLIKKTVGID